MISNEFAVLMAYHVSIGRLYRLRTDSVSYPKAILMSISHTLSDLLCSKIDCKGKRFLERKNNKILFKDNLNFDLLYLMYQNCIILNFSNIGQAIIG